MHSIDASSPQITDPPFGEEDGPVTRFESRVTSVSWIPSEAVTGMPKSVFETGFTHYDEPLPDHLDDLDALRSADRFRFANDLAAWIDVRNGVVVDAGYSGGGLIGSPSASAHEQQRSRRSRSPTSRCHL